MITNSVCVFGFFVLLLSMRDHLHYNATNRHFRVRATLNCHQGHVAYLLLGLKQGYPLQTVHKDFDMGIIH